MKFVEFVEHGTYSNDDAFNRDEKERTMKILHRHPTIHQSTSVHIIIIVINKMLVSFGEPLYTQKNEKRFFFLVVSGGVFRMQKKGAR